MLQVSNYELSKQMKDLGWFSGYYCHKLDGDFTTEGQEREIAEKIQEIDQMVKSTLDLYQGAGVIDTDNRASLEKQFATECKKTQDIFASMGVLSL